MSSPVFTRAALRDVKAIWRYIARDSQRHADLVEDAIFQTCYEAANTPSIGHRRPELSTRKILFLAVREYDSYSIAYAEGSDPLRVLRVVHGARGVPKLFR